jgi:PAS domain S-box-containing protein
MSNGRETVSRTARTSPERRFESAAGYLTMREDVGTQSELPAGGSSAPPDGRFPKIITLAWLTLGIASVALALIAAMVLRSERESTTVLHHLNFLALDLQEVLSDLAEAESAERGYLLTGQPSSLENYKRSRVALDLEFDRLTALVKHNPVERQEVERVRSLVHQDLDELQRSIASRTAARSQAAFAKILTDRGRKLTEALRRTIGVTDKRDEGMLARLVWQRRVRLASALAAVSGALLLAGCYVLIGQIIIARSASRHQKTEAALHASEKRFETLCDRAPVGIFSTDAQGLCVYTNPQWTQMSGLSMAESRGHGWKEALHPDDRETVFESWKTNALQGVSWEYRLLTPQGQIRWIRAMGAPLYSNGGEITGYVGTTEDITELKYAHDTTREALQQLQLITDNLPAGVTRCSRDRRFVWVNRSYAAWLGRAGPEEVSGRLMVDVAGQELFDTIAPYIERVLSGEKVEYEIQVNYLGIGRRWIHAVKVPTKAEDHTIDGWIAVVVDVTERHEAEERLRESEARFRAAFFQAAVGIAQTSVDGKWQLFNDRFCEILGYSRNELCEKALTEKTLIKIAHPDDREAFLAARQKLLNGEISSWSSEGRYIRKDGVIGWARVFVSLVRNQANEPQYFVTVLEDVTEKIQAERSLQQSRQELRALAGRLIHAEDEERRRISRELHDELSQKLALLAMDTGGLLTDPSPPPEKMNTQLRKLQVRVQQLAQNVRQISHQLHPSILDDLGLVAALTELCEEFSAREGIEVACEVEDLPRVLPVDIASSLYRVSQEALHNILKHARASQVRMQVQASSGGIHLWIHDNGVGFDSEAGLLRPGLGIVSMKERISLVQGDLSIDSRPGQGTEVRVFVPLPRKAA